MNSLQSRGNDQTIRLRFSHIGLGPIKHRKLKYIWQLLKNTIEVLRPQKFDKGFCGRLTAVGQGKENIIFCLRECVRNGAIKRTIGKLFS